MGSGRLRSTWSIFGAETSLITIDRIDEDLRFGLDSTGFEISSESPFNGQYRSVG